MNLFIINEFYQNLPVLFENIFPNKPGNTFNYPYEMIGQLGWKVPFYEMKDKLIPKNFSKAQSYWF
jgi:hypothetical protein